MTMEQFFAEARKVKWIVTKRGSVRTASRLRNQNSGLRERQCPLSYVTGQWWPDSTTPRIGHGTGRAIIHAADNASSNRRPWLLKNLGIAR